MILIDSRVGSRELQADIRALGIDAELEDKLDSDFQFTGNGEYGPILVGIERKTIADMLQSMRDRRLAGHQIGCMLETYDVSILLIEGYWRRQRGTGLLEVRNGAWMAARGNHHFNELVSFICSLRSIAGVHILRTGDEEESAAWIAAEYRWWQKEWTEHRTGREIYAPVPDRKRASGGTRAILFRREASLLEKWLAQLPHVDARAYEFAREFASAYEMATADERVWQQIKGVGKKTAKDIVEAIHGGRAEGQLLR